MADLQRGGVVGRRGLINGLLGLILRLRLGFGRGSLLSFVCKERAAGGQNLVESGTLLPHLGQNIYDTS